MRVVTTLEQELLAKLLADSPRRIELLRDLPSATVEDMTDGGMGSIRFLARDGGHRIFGCEAARGDYTDADGVPVRIAVNLDQRGDLYELDFWKVDWSPLVRYPSPSDITISRRTVG